MAGTWRRAPCQLVAGRGRRVAASALQAPDSSRQRAQGWSRGPGAQQRHRENCEGSAGEQETRTHLQTRRSGRARASGAPAHTAADSCCSSSHRCCPSQGGREAERPGARRPRKARTAASAGGRRACEAPGPCRRLACCTHLPPSLACSLPLLPERRRQAGLGGFGAAASSSQADSCSAEAPAARGPD